ncbi:Uncharacterised protein [Mycobacteroides abscessus subsp. abscessus]|nr:Uncharacterised protein [Mycobacteroides abscessus subsp. abscessus]
MPSVCQEICRYSPGTNDASQWCVPQLMPTYAENLNLLPGSPQLPSARNSDDSELTRWNQGGGAQAPSEHPELHGG